jgi:cell division protease FtsH
MRLRSKSYFVEELSVLLGGYVSEKLAFNDVTTGASNDLERATAIARNLITRYGMSELGPRTFGNKDELIFLGKEIQEERNYSEKTAENIDEQVSKFIKNAYEVAEKILVKKKEVLEKLVSILLEKETIEQDEFNQLVGIPKVEEAESD